MIATMVSLSPGRVGWSSKWSNTALYILYFIITSLFFWNEVVGNLDTGCWDGLAHRLAAALAHTFVFTKAKGPGLCAYQSIGNAFNSL